MLRSFAAQEDGTLRPIEGTGGAIWLDLVSPDPDELEAVSREVGVSLPSREEQEEIEHSSRLYIDGGVPFMTILLPSRADSDEMQLGPVTFVLLRDRLLSLRHHAPSPFTTFPEQAGKVSFGCDSAEAVLAGLVEEIIDRLADITEQTGTRIDTVSRHVFAEKSLRTGDYRETLRDIGRADGRVMQLRESLMTVERFLGFLGPVLDKRKSDRDLRSVLKSQYRDTRTILEHVGYLQQKTALLLEATLGMINIEQNAIIKIFSVAAVAFLPPTLVASIYGMNFAHMPETAWRYGYLMAIGVMILSAALPLWFFRRRGWL